jgi:hypothetical protein
MKRQKWKWILLSVGVLLISATCGFGYEAKRTRTQFEEAKDAFEKRDWYRVVSNVSEGGNQRRPSQQAIVSFMHTYIDPMLETGKFKLKSRTWNSNLVPIKDEIVTYEAPGVVRGEICELLYTDKISWMGIPFSKSSLSIFNGKQVVLPFVPMFLRVARARYPQKDQLVTWKSVLEFVRAERSKLTTIGIMPSIFYSKEKTWNDFLKGLEAKNLKPLGSRGTQNVPPAKDSRRP